jgi:hypothetical protein
MKEFARNSKIPIRYFVPSIFFTSAVIFLILGLIFISSIFYHYRLFPDPNLYLPWRTIAFFIGLFFIAWGIVNFIAGIFITRREELALNSKIVDRYFASCFFFAFAVFSIVLGLIFVSTSVQSFTGPSFYYEWGIIALLLGSFFIVCGIVDFVAGKDTIKSIKRGTVRGVIFTVLGLVILGFLIAGLEVSVAH